MWFYSHWSGDTHADAVRRALKFQSRWNDDQYLARIIFDAFVPKKSHGEDTGFGISTSIGDNEHPIVVVDIPKQWVYFIEESQLDNDGRVPDNYIPKKYWAFEEFAKGVK